MKEYEATVTKEFCFDAAHKLEDISGKCESLHGHTWKVQITLKGRINENGIIYDFTKMKAVIDEHVKKHLDHKYLNEIIPQPTAENIALWIYHRLENLLPGIYKIRVYESPQSYATIKFNQL